MSSFTGALAGFLSPGDSSSAKRADGSKKSSHEIFLSNQLVPLTNRLQREIRARRFRDLQPEVQSVIDNLKAFEKEAWPPEKEVETVTTTNSSENVPKSLFESQLNALDQQPDADDASVLTDIEDDNTTITSVDNHVDAEQANKTWDLALGQQGQKLSEKENAMLRLQSLEDDPNTREQVHPSVEEALKLYVTILTHPSKNSKVIVLSLESIQVLVTKQYLSGRAGGRDDATGSGSQVLAAAEREGRTELPPPSLLHQIMEAIASCSNYNNELVQATVVKTFRCIITSNKCGVHEGSLLLALRSAFHVYLVAKSASTRDVAKASLIDMLRSVFGRLEAHDAMLQNANADELTNQESSGVRENDDSAAERNGINENGGGPKSPLCTPMTSQYHTDGYVLFRALCKLSSKELPGDTEPENSRPGLFSTPPDPMALNNKVLSLELILAVMDFSGNAFCQGEKFVYLVQNYLCVGLLKNCMSNHTNVAFLSQKIFLFLVYKFKASLKQEIEVFLSNIFLKVLESPNSSFKQKALVLESLRSLCRDPGLLTQIFLNYDCDFEAPNLYKDIVHNLTKLSGKSTSTPTATLTKREVEELSELSLAGLEVLATIMKTFLKALGLPGGDPGSDESAGEKIRGMLSLDNDLAKRSEPPKSIPSLTDITVSTGVGEDSDMDVSLRGYRSPGTTHNGNEKGDATSSKVAGKIVDAFELKRNQEQNFETGSVKFTLSLKAGMNFFIDNGFVECDAKDIAHFFLDRKDKLDKTQMGEALGREPDAAFVKGDNVDPEKGGPGFFVRILHHYTSALDFARLVFDDAMRLFLSGFRLPGEAQKIDRIMEKFAERYTLQNPDIFPSADTAFILAFSVIMLNTDLHNPSIKPERRMTLDSFIRNNRGIGENGADLPNDFLKGIYDRIKENPFSLKEDEAAREREASQPNQLFDASLFFEGSPFFGTSAEERKREKFKKEREEMMAATTQLIRRRPAAKNPKAQNESSSKLMESVSPADVVKPMFDVTWGPVIGILSQVLECSEEDRCITVCLNGFVYAVRLASHSHMSLARDTFVTSLAKFTFLGSIKEMKQKNIESIRTLLGIAVVDGEFLGESWGPVLQCISQLARLRLSGSGLDSDESFLSDKDIAKTRVSLKPSDSAAGDNKNNARVVLEEINENLIDKVFSNTVNLSAQSLAHFIEQLIAVSTSEVAGNSKGGIGGVNGVNLKVNAASLHGANQDGGPSIFSLQKLVEVADYNMDVRPRLVWAQMWEKMAEFFARISSHENSNVSFFAIDSLKQLSFKFLDKPELSEFNFQRIFLRPFLHVMDHESTREDIRELVLRCLDNIVRTKSHNLRSGWKIIFSILARSAEDRSEKINFLGLAILQLLLDDHLDELCRSDDEDENTRESEEQHTIAGRNRNADVEDFVGLCRASLSFVQKRESSSPRPMGLSMRALCHTAIYADLLAEKRVHPPVSGAQCTDPQAPGYTYSGLDDIEALEMVLWRSLLEGLAQGVKSRARSSAAGLGCLVQRGSVLALRAILIRHGHIFSVSQWEAILNQTLIPAIQDAAENDRSPVIGITSESPQLSSIDFLADSLPMLPPADDPGLLKFESVAVSRDSAPKRAFGKAEVLLEASFTDLRHGGDGNLSRAYILAQKEVSTAEPREQPFPDSWIATTAPIALGLLTDIMTEVLLLHGMESRQRLVPFIVRLFLVWCVGRPLDFEGVEDEMNLRSERPNDTWWPCEALVRISCHEMHRLPERIVASFPRLGANEKGEWTRTMLTMFSAALSKSVTHEKAIQRELFRAKEKVCKTQTKAESNPMNRSPVPQNEPHVETIIFTPYGKGRLTRSRRDCYANPKGNNFLHLTMDVVELNCGATLYRPAPNSITFQATNEIGAEPRKATVVDAASQKDQYDHDASESQQPDDTQREPYWLEYVPALKIRSVAAHCLQSRFYDLFEKLALAAEEDMVVKVMEALKLSRRIAEEAVQDEDLKHVFQEAIVSEWGDGVEEVELALSNVARLSHLHGSAMFFLTQEAGATKALIQMLGILYQSEGVYGEISWDRQGFAEPYFVSTMKDALTKFQDSEEKEGHLIDPNVWRNASESGGKVALYCTAFADVVVVILGNILSLDEERFKKHCGDFFPIICSLVRADSKEIRSLVQRILALHIAPMIGVDPNSCAAQSFATKRGSL